MDPTAEKRSRCRAPLRALCIAAIFSGAAGIAWAFIHFAARGERTHPAADAAQLFALAIGPIWASLGDSPRTRCRLCTFITRRGRANSGADQRPWHER